MAGTALSMWPQSFKTTGINNIPLSTPYATATGSEMGFQIMTPLFLYKVNRLACHFVYQFDSAVSLSDQKLTGVAVRNTPPSGSYTVNNALALNIPAVSGIVDYTIDLTTLLNPNGANCVFFEFPTSVSSSTSGTLILWKLDMLYQVQGNRNQT